MDDNNANVTGSSAQPPATASTPGTMGTQAPVGTTAVQGASAQSPAQSNASASTATSWVDSEGNFKDDWKNSLPENLKTSKSLADIKNINQLITNYVNTKEFVGKKMATMPNENSTEEEKTKFFSEVNKIKGVPESPDKYDFKINDKIPEEFRIKKENIKPYLDILHK